METLMTTFHIFPQIKGKKKRRGRKCKLRRTFWLVMFRTWAMSQKFDLKGYYQFGKNLTGKPIHLYEVIG